jgi:hypothetical protein
MWSKKKKKKKKKERSKGIIIKKTKKKKRKIKLMFKFGKSTMENKVYYWWKIGKRNWLKVPKEAEVPIILENTSKFYYYLFVINFPVLNPTLRPNKSPNLILRIVWFRYFHD